MNAKLPVAVILVGVGLVLVPATMLAQESRITARIDPTRTVALHGNVNPMAQAQYDAGPVDPAFKLNYVTLALKPSISQQADLEHLLADQQDRSSPNYHHWLTPEQYADRFGLSGGDIAQISAWLQSEGFTINYVARGRNWIAFTGTAAQIAAAFHTEIHRYGVQGERHFANASEPSIPVALQPVICGLLGLDDFYPKAPHANSNVAALAPHSTLPNGLHVLAPDDIATIYDIAPLYQAGVDGSGQTIAVVGETNVDITDIQLFRNTFGLPPNEPEVILYGTDPGPSADALTEADLDLEWVGSVARNAQIVYVYSNDAFQAAKYAIDQKLASVLSMSISWCEPSNMASSITFQSTAQQANLEGMTWLASSGDSGAAACDKQGAALVATRGEAVNFPASIPEVTGVGGTEFSEGSGSYWSSSNGTEGGSALSYIPETAWNDSGPAGLMATGGGYSGVYAQPSWQTGPGLSTVNARAVPDVSLAASGAHDGYTIITGGQPTLQGGTSASTPVFAGIVALLNQYEQSNGQGNINPNLYGLSQITTDAFHDITTGSNVVPCEPGTPNCTNGFFGYLAGPGYDPVTGLGSVDAYNLITEWNTPAKPSNVFPSCTPSIVYQQPPDSNGFGWIFTLTLNETAGVATTLTDFTVNGSSLASQIVSLFGTSSIPANGSISAPLGYKTLAVPTAVVFGFSGVDAGGRQWSKTLSVPFSGMQTTPPPAISLSKGQLQFSWTVGTATPPTQSVTVANSGGGTFTWTASSNVSWLNLTSSTGLLTVGLNKSGLSAGNYNGVVSVNATGVSNSPQSIKVALTVQAATPSVVVNAVVNAASYQAGMSPGELATLFGTHLSPVVGIAAPGGATSYRGVSVTVGGVPAPLFAIANVNGQEQINFQVPTGSPASNVVVPVQVNNNGTVGAMNVTLSPVQPGIFQYTPPGSSVGYGIVEKLDGSIVGPTNPAARGSIVIMYATGFGLTSPLVSTGAPGPVPPAYSNGATNVTVGGVNAQVLFSGLAPYFVGLNQVNFAVPESAPVGAGVQLSVSVNGIASPASTIATQ